MQNSDSEDDPDYVPPQHHGCATVRLVLTALTCSLPSDSSEEEPTSERDAKRARLHSPTVEERFEGDQ